MTTDLNLQTGVCRALRQPWTPQDVADSAERPGGPTISLGLATLAVFQRRVGSATKIPPSDAVLSDPAAAGDATAEIGASMRAVDLSFRHLARLMSWHADTVRLAREMVALRVTGNDAERAHPWTATIGDVIGRLDLLPDAERADAVRRLEAICDSLDALADRTDHAVAQGRVKQGPLMSALLDYAHDTAIKAAPAAAVGLAIRDLAGRGMSRAEIEAEAEAEAKAIIAEARSDYASNRKVLERVYA